MGVAFYRLPSLPAGLVNAEAVRSAQEAQARPKKVCRGPKPSVARLGGRLPTVPDEVVKAVRWAREHDGLPMSRIAADFGLDLHQVRGFVEGRTRNHLDAAPLPPGFVWPLQDPPAPL